MKAKNSSSEKYFPKILGSDFFSNFRETRFSFFGSKRDPTTDPKGSKLPKNTKNQKEKNANKNSKKTPNIVPISKKALKIIVLKVIAIAVAAATAAYEM